MKRPKRSTGRAWSRQYRMSNPQEVNWQGMRPKVTGADETPAPTKTYTLDKLEYYQGVKDNLGEAAKSIPPRMGALLRWREVRNAPLRGIVKEEHYGITLIKGLKQLDRFAVYDGGQKYFFLETNFEIGLQSRSILYNSRDRAGQVLGMYMKDNSRGITWEEFVIFNAETKNEI